MSLSPLVFVKDDTNQETTMALRNATLWQLESIKKAIGRLGDRGDAGRALRDYLIGQLDEENADQSVRCAVKNLEGAIREVKEEFRSIMH